MRTALLVLSFLWVAMGAALVLYSGQARSFMRGIFLGVDVRIWSFLALAVGAIFLIGAFLVREVFWIAFLLGMLGIAKGTYLALGPPAQVRSLMEWWLDHASETTIRLWGLIAFTFGVVMVSWLV